MILHHYPSSPFAEKIRAMFGYKGVKWQSVVQPMIMPKPDLQALTGGYRRIPVLQIGADIYCDTGLIVDVIESLSPTPTLFPNHSEGQARTLAQWADSTLFSAAMAYNFSPEGVAFFFKDTPPEQAKAFAEDRKAMRPGSARMAPTEAKSAMLEYLTRFEQILANHPYLLTNSPSLADFSTYHSLWFTQRVPPLASIFAGFPGVSAWLAHMNQLSAAGKSLMEKSSVEESFALAKLSSPAPIPGDGYVDYHGIALGSMVSITAESFGLEATEGKLVAASKTRFTLAREHEKTGLVHVHFPRVGFVLKPLV